MKEPHPIRRHNSFFGWTKQMQTHLEAILHSETATPETIETAYVMLEMVKKLNRTLKERRS